MDDLPISDLLSSRGFECRGAQHALEMLCREGLARRGKTRTAAAKIEAVDRALGGAFVRHCRKPAGRPSPGEAREAVRVSAARCETCGGSDNRREVERMLAASATGASSTCGVERARRPGAPWRRALRLTWRDARRAPGARVD